MDQNQNTRETVCILGAGRFGRALARVVAASGSYNVIIGSRTFVQKDLDKECPKCIVKSYEEAINASSLVILAVPHKATTTICNANQAALEGKIVVEVSNIDAKERQSGTNYEKLKGKFPEIRFVKCFNTISAHGLEEYTYPIGFVGEALVCGDDLEAKQVCMDFSKSIGIPVRDLGDSSKIPLVEYLPFRFFQEWIIPTLIVTILIVIFNVLVVVWLNQLSLENWARFTLVYSKVFGDVAINMVALAYLPGALAQFVVYSHYYEDKHYILPQWLYKWLGIRKQLGLLGFLFVILHIILEVIQFSPSYYPPLFETKGLSIFFTITTEIGIFLGSVAVGFGIVLSVISLPEIARIMSWREWRFIQTYLGWLYLIASTAHVLVLLAGHWPKSQGAWFGGVPPSSIFATALPMFVILVKILALIYIGFVLLRGKKSKDNQPQSQVQQEQQQPQV